MRFGKRAWIALLAVALAFPAAAQEPRAVAHPEELGFAPDRLDRITKTFQSYVDNNELPGAVVLIARNDRIAYFKAIGFRDRERKAPMTSDAIFRIASMTKPITTVAAMTLVEEGRLDLAAPVSQYLPEFKDLQVSVERTDPATGKIVVGTEPQARPMTVQDLLRHTSGFVYGPPNGAGPVSLLYQDTKISNRDETLAQMVTKLSMLPLALGRFGNTARRRTSSAV